MSETTLVAPAPPNHPPNARPPGPKGHPIYGVLWEFHADPVAFQERIVGTYGDIARFRFFHLPVYLLANPDDIRTVLADPEGAFVKGMALDGFRPLVGKGLLLNEGDSHRRQRRMMQPAFHRQRVAGYGEVMLEEAQRVSAKWAAAVASGRAQVDMDTEMNRLTLTIAARTLFGAGITDTEASDVAEAMSAFTQWYHQSTHPMGALLQALPTEATRSFKAAKKKLGAVVDRMIKARREGGDTGDILSMLVFARDAEGDGTPGTIGGGMSNEHVHDEAITLLVAGHETTGATLAWAWALLARHPEVATRLRAELDAVLGDRAPTVEDAPKLDYARNVFAEALRLYPSATALPRQAVKPVVLGGYTVPKGAIVMCAAWACHHDPRFWDDPQAFRPERWTAEGKATRPKFAFFPFGGGARVCIGEAFAWMEGTLLLATLARQWSASVAPGHTVVPEALFTVRPKGGLPMVLAPRV
ncbi:MAG: cytochrome P450 [Pseudomonadota bacterium]|nr:cytochrome P450 [Pseudomonadota bacterium]